MKQFDLDEYLKDTTQKVVTRDGRSVRIVCTDVLDCKYSIVALVLEDGEEYVKSFTKDGMFYGGEKPSKCDLFFADKEPSYRPYANAEECFKDVIKHGGWMRHKVTMAYMHITWIDQNCALCGEDPIEFNEILEAYLWVDKTPCGVKEE